MIKIIFCIILLIYLNVTSCNICHSDDVIFINSYSSDVKLLYLLKTDCILIFVDNLFCYDCYLNLVDFIKNEKINKSYKFCIITEYSESMLGYRIIKNRLEKDIKDFRCDILYSKVKNLKILNNNVFALTPTILINNINSNDLIFFVYKDIFNDKGKLKQSFIQYAIRIINN